MTCTTCICWYLPGLLQEWYKWHRGVSVLCRTVGILYLVLTRTTFELLSGSPLGFLSLHFDYSVVCICMIHCRCSLLNFGCYCNSKCTFDIYATYKLLTWTRAHHMCKKHREHPALESQEPHRTTLHSEEYESEEHKPLLVGCEQHRPLSSRYWDWDLSSMWEHAVSNLVKGFV